MGKLLDKFKEKVQQYNSIQLPEEPDKLAKPDEWLQWNIKKRSSEVTKDAIKNALMSPKLSPNTWYEVLKEALGQEEADAIRAQETTRSGYWNAAELYIKEHPELLNHLTKEQKHDFEFDTNKYRRTVLTQLINEKRIPDEALEEAKLYNYTSNLIHFDIEKQLKVAGAFEKLLNPEQLKAVEDKLDSEADVLTLPDEKRMEYPYRNICNTLKANASKVIPNNPEKLKEYEDALSYASEHINMPSNAYRDELKKQEADGEKVTGEYEKSVKAKFTDGKYRDLY